MTNTHHHLLKTSKSLVNASSSLQTQGMRRSLLHTPLHHQRKWDFELRHRMQPKKDAESTTRKAKLHAMDTRLLWSDIGASNVDRVRENTAPYVDNTRDPDSKFVRSMGSEAVKRLYQQFDEPCRYFKLLTPMKNSNSNGQK